MCYILTKSETFLSKALVRFVDHNESVRKGIESGKRSEKTRTSCSDSTLAYEQLVTKSLGVKSGRAVPLIFSMMNIRVYKTLPV